MGSESGAPCGGEEHHHLHRPVFPFLLPHGGQLVLNKRCEDGEVILERCNQIFLGYMSVCRLFFLGDRRNVLVRWEQIKVCNLKQLVSPSPVRKTGEQYKPRERP